MKKKILLFVCAGMLSTAIVAQDIDLLIENGGQTFNGSTNVITLNFDVRNAGADGLGFSTGARVAFYLSNDALFDGSDYLITYADLSFGIFAGACYCGNSIPSDIDIIGAPSGNYNVLMVADDLGLVAETNESNNLVNVGIINYTGGGPVGFANNADNAESALIHIYPNPSSGTFEIRSQKLESSGQNIALKIYDVFGKMVYQKTSNSIQQTINTELSKGIYYLYITTNKEIWNEKIIIQ